MADFFSIINNFQDTESKKPSEILSSTTLQIFNINELSLFDLQDVLRYVDEKRQTSKLKEIALQLYSIFSMMKPIFSQLHILFLYDQLDILCNCFGKLFLIEKDVRQQISQSILIDKRKSVDFIEKKKESEEIIDSCQKKGKVKLNKLSGIFIYNESYERNMDSKKQKSEKKINFNENNDELWEKSQQLQDEEVSDFIKERKNKRFDYESFCFEDLMKLEELMKESQKEITQFLLNYQIDEGISYNLEISENLNEIVGCLKSQKMQRNMLGLKLKQMMNLINKIIKNLEDELQKKEREIIAYKERKQNLKSISTQTKKDDEMVLKLKIKIQQLTKTLDIHENAKNKIFEQQRKIQESLRNTCQQQNKEINILKQTVDMKEKTIKYHEQKNNFLHENMKLKNNDLFTNFFSLNDEAKFFFINELNNQGLLNTKKKRKKQISILVDKQKKQRIQSFSASQNDQSVISIEEQTKQLEDLEQKNGKKAKSLFFKDQKIEEDENSSSNSFHEKNKSKKAISAKKNFNKKIKITPQALKKNKVNYLGKLSRKNLDPTIKSINFSKKSIETNGKKSIKRIDNRNELQSKRVISIKSIRTLKDIHTNKSITFNNELNDISSDDIQWKNEMVFQGNVKNKKKNDLPKVRKEQRHIIHHRDRKEKISKKFLTSSRMIHKDIPKSHNLKVKYEKKDRDKEQTLPFHDHVKHQSQNSKKILKKKQSNSESQQYSYEKLENSQSLEISQKYLVQISRKCENRERFKELLKQYHQKKCKVKNCLHLERYLKKFELYKRISCGKENLKMHTFIYK